MVYQVGRPAMFEGKRFLPETGTPIWKSVRSSTMFALCEPDPFTVATCRLMSLITGCVMDLLDGCGPTVAPRRAAGQRACDAARRYGVLDPECGPADRVARAGDPARNPSFRSAHRVAPAITTQSASPAATHGPAQRRSGLPWRRSRLASHRRTASAAIQTALARAQAMTS